MGVPLGGGSQSWGSHWEGPNNGVLIGGGPYNGVLMGGGGPNNVVLIGGPSGSPNGGGYWGGGYRGGVPIMGF